MNTVTPASVYEHLIPADVELLRRLEEDARNYIARNPGLPARDLAEEIGDGKAETPATRARWDRLWAGANRIAAMSGGSS